MHIYKNLFGNFLEVCVYLGRLYISQGNRLNGFFFSIKLQKIVDKKSIRFS